MDALAIINKYYPEDNELKHIRWRIAVRWPIRRYGLPESIRN